MGIVAEFVTNYRKEVDFYEAAAALVAHRLEDALRASGVRAIVTYRAKSAIRLEQKCRRRNETKFYQSFTDIYDDVTDLSGVRVALYFPGEREQVGHLVNQMFAEVAGRKIFPNRSKQTKDKRFLGYSAVHHRICLADGELKKKEKKFAGTKVEIQVASVFMHAWAEVEHDLVYRSLGGELSENEYAILDCLNGLVLTGEVSLELLQRAGEDRIAARGRDFANHYELTVYLLKRAGDLPKSGGVESGLGRVDVLARFLQELDLNTPEAIEPYIQELHHHFELRPVAEQIADAILAQDGRRYQCWREVRIEVFAAANEPVVTGDAMLHEKIGFFISQWVELESILGLDIDSERLLSPEDNAELMALRYVRNGLVHGQIDPKATELQDAGERTRELNTRLQKAIDPPQRSSSNA